MERHALASDTRAPAVAELVAPFRATLSGLAFRLLGSFADTERALAQTQTLLADEQPAADDLGDWLTLTTARASLRLLRQRAAGPPQFAWSLPDFVVTLEHTHDAHQSALLAGGTGSSLFAALHGLGAEERVAHVLHDSYGVPAEVVGAEVLDLPMAAVEELVALARDAIDHVVVPDEDLERQHTAVRNFYRVARRAEHEAIVELFHPDFRLQNDSGQHVLSGVFAGPTHVVQRAILITRSDLRVRPALINGAAGAVISNGSTLVALASFTVVDGLLARVHTLADHARISLYDIPGLER